MREIHWLLLAFAIFVMGCGRDKEKDPPPPPSPVPPVTKPKEPETKEPGNWPFPFPMPKLPIPGLPSIPGLPNIPGMPGGGSPAPSPTPNPAPTPYPGDVYNLGQSVNEARAARGLSAVEILPALNCAAKRHADDIGARKACGHTGQDGSSPWDRAKDCGTFANGEIVACGQGDAKAAVQAWTYSPGHAAIMYDGGQKKMGVAMYQNYWVVIFQK